MKRVLLIAAVLLGGCEGMPETTTETSELRTRQLTGTWQSGRATLALTPTGDYTYIAPTGAIVGFARWSIEGNTLKRAGFPDATVTLSGDTMAVSTPGEGNTGTLEVFQRVATYCQPTAAQQPCR